MRRQLAWYSLAVAFPILVFVGFLLWLSAAGERTRIEENAVGTARQIAAAVDRDLNGLGSAALALSLSSHLRVGDLAAFHAQASELSALEGINIVLRSPEGRQLVNVRVPYGTPLPDALLPVGSAVSQRRPYVSDFRIGQVSGEQQFVLTVPVMNGDRVLYFLSFAAPVTRIRDVILAAEPRQDRVIAAIDRVGVILARNIDQQTYAGQPATADLQANTTGKEGTWVGTTIDGSPVLGAYSRVELSDWRVAVGIPRETLVAPLRRSFWLVASVGLALLLAALALGHGAGLRLIAPIRALAAQAERLGRGQPVGRVDSRIPEINKAGEALHLAAMQLGERERALRQANETLEAKVAERTAELQETNARLIAEGVQRARAEEELRQAQKMEALGQLTGGIAHDFNNMLAVVMSGLDLLQRRLERGDGDVLRYVDAAREGAHRAAALTQRLLAFSRRQPLAPEPVDVGHLVEGMSELLARTLGETVHIEADLADGLWATHVDPGQLENSLVNLAVNARDAMPGGGVLRLGTANVTIPPGSREGPAPGDYVLLTVADTGTGMTREVAARAIDPFFTTKGVGKGTGLGLSQVYGFVRQSGGHLAIDTAPGEGTVVRLHLPRFSGEAPVTDKPATVPLAPEFHGTGETILLVEDEARVRELTAAALKDLGFAVEAVDGAAAALEAIASGRPFALLLTDLVMPETSGAALAAEARRRLPGLRVVYMTGYASDTAAIEDGATVLAKPFTFDQLAAKIQAVLRPS